jgi:hypothetical protein
MILAVGANFKRLIFLLFFVFPKIVYTGKHIHAGFKTKIIGRGVEIVDYLVRLGRIGVWDDELNGPRRQVDG